MFLLDPNECARAWDDVQGVVHGMIERDGGKLLLTQRLDDMKLAYEVAGHKRGTYYLVHMEAPGDAIATIRARAALTEVVLRLMIVIDEDGVTEISPTMLQMSRSEGPFQRRDGGMRRGGGRDRDRRYEGGHGDRDRRHEGGPPDRGPRRHERESAPDDKAAPAKAEPAQAKPAQDEA